MVKATDAQLKANNKWNEKNRKHKTYLSKKSTAKSFVRNNATAEDLEELEQLIKGRKKDL